MLHLKKRYIATITIIYASVIIAVNIPHFVVTSELLDGGEKTLKFGPGYLLYGAYIVSYFIAAFVILLKKFRVIKDIVLRKQILYLFTGTLTASIIGLTTNLVLPYATGYFKLFWFGPVATIIMIVFVGYATIRHSLFDVKVVAVESTTFILWVAMLIRLFLSAGRIDFLINLTLFIFVITGGLVLIKNISREIHAKEELITLAANLKKANMRLQELDRQKSEFVSIASHQLKSPLTAIKGYASLLLEGSFGALSVKAKEPTERIFESSVRLVNVIEDFLNITRIEQGRMKYDSQKVDILAMVRDIVRELAPTIERAGLKTTIVADKRKEYIVSADASKLRQVFSNLIDNAVKYTPKGMIDVELAKDDSARTITLCVRDTGIGFSPVTKVILFQKFGRGNGVEKLHTEGSGIGLYIAREIVKAHNGRVWAESLGEGKGSRFCVELPAV